jgi:hypothetical protein
MPMQQPPGAAEFSDSLAQLEAQIAASDAAGDLVPPEARQMAVKLRELVDALGDLTSTLGAPSADDALPIAPPPAGDKAAEST